MKTEKAEPCGAGSGGSVFPTSVVYDTIEQSIGALGGVLRTELFGQWWSGGEVDSLDCWIADAEPLCNLSDRGVVNFRRGCAYAQNFSGGQVAVCK